VGWWNYQHKNEPPFLILSRRDKGIYIIPESEAGELFDAGWVPPKVTKRLVNGVFVADEEKV